MKEFLRCPHIITMAKSIAPSICHHRKIRILHNLDDDSYFGNKKIVDMPKMITVAVNKENLTMKLTSSHELKIERSRFKHNRKKSIIVIVGQKNPFITEQMTEEQKPMQVTSNLMLIRLYFLC